MRSLDGSARDEALIEALSTRRRLPAEHLDDDLALALAAWVGELDAGLAPSPRAAEAQCPAAGEARCPVAGEAQDPAAGAAQDPTAVPDLAARRRGRRVTRRVVVAAAVLAVVSTGGVAAAERAMPGSPLWGLSRLMNPDRAASLEARQLADSSLRRAEEALAQGRYDDARQRLAEARSQLAAVRGSDGRADLDARAAAIDRQLAGVPGGSVSAVPGQPNGVPTGSDSEPAEPARPAPGSAEPPDSDTPPGQRTHGVGSPPAGDGASKTHEPGGSSAGDHDGDASGGDVTSGATADGDSKTTTGGRGAGRARPTGSAGSPQLDNATTGGRQPAGTKAGDATAASRRRLSPPAGTPTTRRPVAPDRWSAASVARPCGTVCSSVLWPCHRLAWHRWLRQRVRAAAAGCAAP